MELGLSLSDMDDVTIGFICELIEEHNNEFDKTEDVCEATPEMLERF